MIINTWQYITTFLKIINIDSEVETFNPNHPQTVFYESIKECHRKQKPIRIIVLKARQIGISTMTEAVIFKKTATKANIHSAIITHKDEATTNLFNMFKFYLDNLPEELKPEILASNAKELIFNNKDNTGLNSRIKCMTANAKGVGRSDTIINLHASEFAWWEGDKLRTLGGLLSSIPKTPDSMVIIESTANGYDEFKDLWDAAVRGENDFIPIFFPWFSIPRYREKYDGSPLTQFEESIKAKYNLDNEQIAWRRWAIRNICFGDEELFKQEFPSYPDEAFLVSGTCIFDTTKLVKRLEDLYLDYKKNPPRTGYFEYIYDDTKMAGDKISGIKWIDDSRGYITLYEETKKRYPYVIGGDTAGDGSDFFTGNVIDNTTGNEVATLRNLFDEDLYAKQMYCLGKYYNTALIGIETNFSSYPIKELQRLGYPKLYVREIEDDFTGRVQSKYGFRTTTITRPVIIGDLVKIFRENPGLFHDRTLLQEMLTFCKNKEGKAEAMPGKHDDTVMAKAITFYIREQQLYQVGTDIENVEIDNMIEEFFGKETERGGKSIWQR